VYALPASELQSAFKAAWGDAAVQFEASSTAGAESLTAVPVRLEPLDKGRYALIIRETSPGAAHAALGAVSVAYLRRDGAAWRSLGLWREIAWIGESGGGAITLSVRRDLAARPLLLVRAPHLGQGDEEVSAAAVLLGARSPKALGVLPLDGDNTGAGYPDQQAFSYHAVIVPSPGALLAVRYRGWTALGNGEPQRPFRRTIAFRIRRGCLAPVGRLGIPGGDYPTTFNCKAAASPP